MNLNFYAEYLLFFERFPALGKWRKSAVESADFVCNLNPSNLKFAPNQAILRNIDFCL